MKTHRQKTNWIIDALLFVGFLLSFSMGFIGMALHQRLGIVLGALAAYHLWVHWKWVRSVTQRLASDAPARDLLYWLVDACLASGFVLIIATGLVLSIWLDGLWLSFHLTISIATLGLVVLKVGLHWRWIIHNHLLKGIIENESNCDQRKPYDGQGQYGCHPDPFLGGDERRGR